MKIKKDKFFRERGSSAKIIKVQCIKCGDMLLTYQKDGPGWLKRCYLNRIISPENYHDLQFNKTLKEKDLGNLVCACGKVIGSPMKHKDGRLAFHLIRGNFKRLIAKNS
ncbi:MAG: hypothetical protein Q7S27_03065 [Nanoarchaeota archaeon]|nr:hypothetical protein [Nanoarchaeota archaeon]